MFYVHLTCRLQQHLFPDNLIRRLVFAGDVRHRPLDMLAYLLQFFSCHIFVFVFVFVKKPAVPVYGASGVTPIGLTGSLWKVPFPTMAVKYHISCKSLARVYFLLFHFSCNFANRLSNFLMSF